MRITERRLRQIIKSVVNESAYQTKSASPRWSSWATANYDSLDPVSVVAKMLAMGDFNNVALAQFIIDNSSPEDLRRLGLQ